MSSDVDKYDYIFTVVRNPWARVVSFYHWVKDVKNKHVMLETVSQYDNFNDWVRHGMDGYHYTSTTSLIPPSCMFDYISPIAKYVDVYKLEYLADRWPELLRKIGCDYIPLPKLNTSKHKPYIEYYTTETKYIVNRHFTRDITYFKYTFD